MELGLEIIGNVGNEPELRVIESGRQVLSFSVAHTEKWITKAGEQREKTYWVKCYWWFSPESEVKVKAYLKKGSLVKVNGLPEVEKWIKDGEAKAAQALTVHRLRLLGGCPKDVAPTVPGVDAPPTPTDAPNGLKGDEKEDDLPF